MTHWLRLVASELGGKTTQGQCHSSFQPCQTPLQAPPTCSAHLQFPSQHSRVDACPPPLSPCFYFWLRHPWNPGYTLIHNMKLRGPRCSSVFSEVVSASSRCGLRLGPSERRHCGDIKHWEWCQCTEVTETLLPSAACSRSDESR